MSAVSRATVVLYFSLCAALVLTTRGAAARQLLAVSSAQEPRSDVSRWPTEWVPFSADMRITTNSGEHFGEWHRSATGSVAVYVYTPVGVAITLHNRERRLTYIKLGDAPWRSTPHQT